MGDGASALVIAGLAIGFAFVLVFAFAFQPVTALSNEQLVTKSKEIGDVQHFLSKYPDAKVDIRRDLTKVTISYHISKHLSQPTDNYPDGVTRERILVITYNAKPESDGMLDLRMYCVGIPNPLATVAYGMTEDDMISRIDNEGCFGRH